MNWRSCGLSLLLAIQGFSAVALTIRIPAGAEPSAAFREAVARVRADGGGEIEFAAGDYAFDERAATDMRFYISNHDQRDVHRVQLPVVGVTNLTIRGNGARFFFQGDVIPLVLLDTQDVRVEGLSLDWKKPFVFEARITGFANGRTQTDRQPDFKPSKGMLFRGDTHEIVERTGTVSVRRDHSKVGARVGDILAMRPGDRPAPAVVVYRAVRSTFEDVVVHACHGMAWIVQRSEDFTLRGRGRATDRTCGVFPSAGRVVSADADATHFSNVKGTVVVENCCFEGMMDDAINVHSTCLAIQEVCAPNAIRCRYMHFQAIGFETFRPGETLRLIRGATLENGPELKVTDVRRLDERTVVLTLDRPLPTGYGVGDAVENADYQPAVVFRGNVVARNRARGALFTTPKRIVCADNLFDHVSGAAILFAGDAQGWYESGACRDVLVTNNVFRNCTTSRHAFGFTEAVITLYPEIKDLATQRARYHRNVRIVGNRFETFDVPLLYSVSCSNLVFCGNSVVRNADYAGWGDGTFLVQATEGFVTDHKEVLTRNPYARSGVPYIMWAQPKPINLPPLLKTEAGQVVASSNDWERVRRPELLKMYTDLVYGRRPVERPKDLAFAPAAPDAEALDGKAVRKCIRISFSGPYGKQAFEALAFIPKAAKPVPAFLLICNRDPALHLDPTRTHRTEFWPVEELVRRGYAAVAFWNGGVAPDEYNGFTNGVHAVFTRPEDRGRHDWGTLSAWAWGASRVLDWIETEKTINARLVAVVGHSRGGKTSLWAGATDRRFALTCVNDSGCGGARLNHLMLPDAETIGLLAVVQPHWMCAAWGDWLGREHETPFDQHQLMALVAPRLLAIGSASKDYGAGPWGEYSSAKYASPAWDLFGWKGLVSRHFPCEDEAQQRGRISYHLRKGAHDLNLKDWTCYMDFFDQWRGWGYRNAD